MTEKRPHYVCDKCEGHNEPYMVHKHLWELAGFQKTDRVCLTCLASALERDLTLDDFTDVPLNLPILIGALMMTPNLKVGRRVIAIREYANKVQAEYLQRWKTRTLYKEIMTS